MSSILTVTSSVVIAAPPSKIYAFISSPSNWAGLHPGSKEIIGEGTAESAAVGLKFIEVIETSTAKFDAHWQVTKTVPDKFFQFEFPAYFSHGPFHQIVITYTLIPKPEGTKFVRTMTSYLTGDEAVPGLEAFAEPEMHNKYLESVKSRVDS